MNHHQLSRTILTQCFRLVRNKYFFYGLLLFNLLLISLVKFYPSLDGPAHLHNANLLRHLILKNEFLETFYTINEVSIPNWISHVFLAMAGSVLPAWLAEKLLLMAYITGMAFSFRYFVKQVNPENIYLSVLVLPFAYTFLFHLGFYNFSLSFIFLFYALGLYSKILHNKTNNTLTGYIALFLSITLCYYSNALIFCFLGLTLGILVIQDYILHKKDLTENDGLTPLFKNLLKLLLVSFPGLVMLLIFILRTNFHSSGQQETIHQLIKWIINLRALIIYSYNSDETFTQVIFILLLILLVTNLGFLKKKGEKIIQPIFIIIPLVLSFIFLLSVPDGASAGMMSIRFCTLFSFFFLLWLGYSVRSQHANGLIILLIVSLHIGLLLKHQNGTIKKLDEKAQILYNASQEINHNSVVLPVYLSSNWLTQHFSNYIATEKPVVVLENYEDGLGWFPLSWNSEAMPNIQLENQPALKHLNWISNSNSDENKKNDYILLIGDQGKISEYDDLRIILKDNFIMQFESPDNFLTMYKYKNSKD